MLVHGLLVPALVAPDPYRGDNDRVYPVPMVNYDSDSFYFHSLTAGYYLWKDQQDQLSATAFYSPWRFRASDSDDWRMKRLNNRYATVMAGLSYSHHEAWGTLRASFVGDILDNSNGTVGDLAYLYTLHHGDWSFTPGVGVTGTAPTRIATTSACPTARRAAAVCSSTVRKTVGHPIWS